jgi:hypothetical protein
MVKLSLRLIKCYAMKTNGRLEVRALPFLISALDGGEWSASHPGRFTSGGNQPRYPLDRRLGGPQSQSEHYGEEKNLPPFREWNPGRPALARGCTE